MTPCHPHAGIAEGFRRRSLARELIRRSVEQVESDLPEVQAVFLHVARQQMEETVRRVKFCEWKMNRSHNDMWRLKKEWWFAKWAEKKVDFAYS